ncbi:deoxynucleoside kinase, partial [bacterium]|nr:deoxynucleoside kinase [bacterium]
MVVSPDKRENNEIEFTPRDYFLREFSGFVDDLKSAEALLRDSRPREDVAGIVRRRLSDIELNFAPQETELFMETYLLFSIKHLLPPFNHIPETVDFMKGSGKQDLVIEIGGPIAVGKTILAEFLAENIGARMESEKFEPSHNPFLAHSYENPDLMFRTQLSFLLDNVSIGLRGKYYDGRWVRDTSVWSDIFVFMEWRRQAGIVSAEEYRTYMELVSLLDPVIIRPDLLIMLRPNSVVQLAAGHKVRIEDNPEERAMERSITREDLEIVDQAGQEAALTLSDRHGINVFVVEVDPVEIYTQPDLRYETVYRIRERLGILKELLTKDPQEVADEIVRILATKTEPQVIGVHSKGMFTGKTSTLNFLAEKINSENVIAFQPAAAIRYGPEHEYSMIDRDRRSIPAITIKDNKLAGIAGYLRTNRIVPDKTPFV